MINQSELEELDLRAASTAVWREVERLRSRVADLEAELAEAKLSIAALSLSSE